MISIIGKYKSDLALMDQMDSIMMNLTAEDQPFFEYILCKESDETLSAEADEFVTSAVQGGFPIKVESMDKEYKEMIHKDSKLIFLIEGCVRTPDFLNLIYNLMERMGPCALVARSLPGDTNKSLVLTDDIEIDGRFISYHTEDIRIRNWVYLVSEIGNSSMNPTYHLHNGLIVEDVFYND